MARVPITVMGNRCERCDHEWVPRGSDQGPRVCPECKSPYWDRPKKSPMSYEKFKDKIESTLKNAGRSLTWTEIRTEAKLPHSVPNNKWVRQMEQDIGLLRWKDGHGIMRWGFTKES